MLTKEEAKRLTQIEQKAIEKYINKTDMNMYDWVDEDNKKEYARLFKKDCGICIVCGEIECLETCDENND